MPTPKKRLPVALLILLDVLATGTALCIFSLFHHVLPQVLKAEGIQIVAQESGSASAETVRQDVITDLRVKFAEHFSDTVITTENSYTSPDVSITVTKDVSGSGSDTITYYVADIYLADVTLLKTGFAQNAYGKGLRDSLTDMDVFYDALLSVGGDYYGNHDDGVVIRNGEVYRSKVTGEDICVLYSDGTMKTFSPQNFDIDEAVAKGAWQAWTFGPMLLDGSGGTMISFNTSAYLKKSHPRTAIGYYEPGHYCFVVIDGRDTGYSKGMTLDQMSQLFASLGCRAAYNLDGGKSAVMVYNNSIVNQPDGGGRDLSDCVYIAESIS